MSNSEMVEKDAAAKGMKIATEAITNIRTVASLSNSFKDSNPTIQDWNLNSKHNYRTRRSDHCAFCQGNGKCSINCPKEDVVAWTVEFNYSSDSGRCIWRCFMLRWLYGGQWWNAVSKSPKVKYSKLSHESKANALNLFTPSKADCILFHFQCLHSFILICAV